MSDLDLAVLGGGVIGLTTALELKREFPNAKINIFADSFNNTTSHVAAGIFRPGSGFSGPNEEITEKWINDSYYYWSKILKSPEASLAGVTQISGYVFSSENPQIVRNRYLEKLVPVYRKATPEELQLCPGNWKYGSFFTTVLTDCSEYLPWITTKLTEKNVNFVTQNLTNFGQVGHFDVVINCTGLGAKNLCHDHELVPIRGQVLKVEAPFIKTFFYGNFDTYIIPGSRSVTLGGCRNYDSYDLNINKYDTMSIKERCESLVPSLRTAKVLAEKVGLRPYRPTVRIDKETKIFNGRKMKIVHNYGHGGYGVTTAPGSALQAVKLVREMLSGSSKL